MNDAARSQRSLYETANLIGKAFRIAAEVRLLAGSPYLQWPPAPDQALKMIAGVSNWMEQFGRGGLVPPDCLLGLWYELGERDTSYWQNHPAYSFTQNIVAVIQHHMQGGGLSASAWEEVWDGITNDILDLFPGKPDDVLASLRERTIEIVRSADHLPLDVFTTEEIDTELSTMTAGGSKAAAEPEANPSEQALTITPSEPTRFRHGPDFRDCTWNGERYTFTATQAACIKALWEERDKGTLELSQQLLLEASGAESQQLKDVFKNQRAWNKMILRGSKAGLYKLAEPT